LRDFFYALGGIKTGFRLIAPDDNFLDFELIGTGDGEATDFPIIKTYSATALAEYGGASLSYVRRIVKPAAGGFDVYVADALIPLVTGSPSAGQARVNYTTGIVTLGTPPAEDAEVRVSGGFHVPVRFGGDYFNPKHDVSANLQSVELIELLPQTLGIE